MNGRDFIDTNVLVYALDAADTRRQGIARSLVARAVAGEFAVSVQVLAELAATLLEKYQSKLTVQEVLAILDSLKPIPLIKPDADMVRRAVEARAAYGLQFYDGMIISAAERAGSQKIWSEDLNPGQTYFGVAIANPFV